MSTDLLLITNQIWRLGHKIWNQFVFSVYFISSISYQGGKVICANLQCFISAVGFLLLDILFLGFSIKCQMHVIWSELLWIKDGSLIMDFIFLWSSELGSEMENQNSVSHFLFLFYYKVWSDVKRWIYL